MTAMSVTASAASFVLLMSGILTMRAAASINTDTYYLLSQKGSDPPKYFYAKEEENQFDSKEIEYVSSDDTSNPRYHWRFIPHYDDDGSFIIKNRATGRVIYEGSSGNLVTIVSNVLYIVGATERHGKKFESSDMNVQEVATYYAADKNEDDTVDVTVLDNRAIEQDIIVAGLDVVSKLKVFSGFSFGVNLFMNILQLKYASEQYSMTEILEHLAKQIIDIAENIAEAQIAGTKVSDAISNMKTNRNWFVGEETGDYPNVLSTVLTSQDMGDFKEHVLQNLDKTISDHIDDVVKGLVDSNYDESTNYDVNIRVAQDGWPILTSGMVEVAAMIEEYTWAKAYYNFKHLKSLHDSGTDTNNEYEADCDNTGLVYDVMTKFRVDSTNSFINILEAQQQMLIDHRKSLWTNNKVEVARKWEQNVYWEAKKRCMVRCEISEDGNPSNNEVERNKIYWTEKKVGERSTVVGQKNCNQKYDAYSTSSCNNLAAWNMYNEETLWDMEHFSYRMDEEKEFFEGFEQILLAICENVKADPDASYMCKTVDACQSGYTCCLATAQCLPVGSTDCSSCVSEDECGEGEKCCLGGATEGGKVCKTPSGSCGEDYIGWEVASTDLCFDGAWDKHKTGCADSDYDIFVTAEPHIRMVATPSQNRLDADCPAVILHASIQDDLQMNKEVMFTTEETDFNPFDIVWVGKRSFSQIAKVFEIVKIDPADNLYDVVHSNCGAIVLEAALMLDIFPEKNTIDFIVGKLIEDGSVTEAIRAPGSNIQSIFGDDSRETSELRTNEELLFRLIENMLRSMHALR